MLKKKNFDTKSRQVCHRLTVNTGKFMVYCWSLTWLSPLGKPRLWPQSVQKWPKWHHRHRFNIKVYILKTYELKKQKQKQFIWNKKY
jgi:hypothetical protein